MRKILNIKFAFAGLSLLGVCFLSAPSLFAQGHHWGDHHGNWPDSLTVVTISGTVMVDTTFFHPLYYLDENEDGVLDYQLAFGPWWYEPSSGATRPNHGDTVTVKGALRDDLNPPLIVVFEINGLTWRDPIEVGPHGWYPFCFWPDSLAVISANGFVLVDTTYFYFHYYLDEEGDGMPEYLLNFGPPWYEPASGATRPQEGDSVWVEGGLYTETAQPIIIVYEINGLKWRDPAGPPPWSGCWMHRNFGDTTYIFCPTDSLDRVGFPAGCMMGMGWMMAPDSIYCQFEEIYPDSLPGGPDTTRFVGYYFNFYNPSGHGMMGWQGMGHGMMRFNRGASFRLHYDNRELASRGLVEENLKPKYWDEDSSAWVNVSGYSVNTEGNVVSFASTRVNSYYALSAKSAATSVSGPSGEVASNFPQDFTLFQNYPNPFNPTTTISYALPESRGKKTFFVSLRIYNLLGQKVVTLVDEQKEVGYHTVTWDGKDEKGDEVSNGVFFIVLRSAGFTVARKMVLLR